MRKVIAAAVLAQFFSLPAAADPATGFYLGAEFGQSSVDASTSDLDDSMISAFESVGLSVIDGSSNLNDDSFTYGLVAGYRFLPYLAVEAAYIDLGEVEYNASGTLTDGTSVLSGSASIDGTTKGPALSALGILPFADTWSVYARVGVYFSDADYDLTVDIDAESASDSISDSTEELFWGIGAGFTGGPWTTRLEYQLFTDVGSDSAIGETDVSRFVIGFMYQF